MIAPPAHTRRAGSTTDSWITPKWILERLGPFDLDPCACNPQPWKTADRQFTEDDDGLMRSWNGFVWCNPPYGRSLGAWLNRMALHNNGIALVFARTDTRAFHAHVFPFASTLLFLCGRITFCRPNGDPAPFGHNSGGPSVLIGYGAIADSRIQKCSDLGAIATVTNSSAKPIQVEAA